MPSNNAPTNGSITDLPLTNKQRRVVRLCALGCTIKQTSRILGICTSTVDNHRATAMRRIGARGLADLIRHAIESGISPLGDALTDEERQMLVSTSDPRQSLADAERE